MAFGVILMWHRNETNRVHILLEEFHLSQIVVQAPLKSADDAERFQRKQFYHLRRQANQQAAIRFIDNSIAYRHLFL